MSQYLLCIATSYSIRKRRLFLPTTSPVNECKIHVSPRDPDLLIFSFCSGALGTASALCRGGGSRELMGRGGYAIWNQEVDPHAARGLRPPHQARGRPCLPWAVPWAEQLGQETLGGEGNTLHPSLMATPRTPLRAGTHTEWAITFYTCEPRQSLYTQLRYEHNVTNEGLQHTFK